MTNVKRLPSRNKVSSKDTWDLSKLFENDAAWDQAFEKCRKKDPLVREEFRGTLSDGAKSLADCLKFDSNLDRQMERLGNYAYLRTTEDQANNTYQAMIGRFQHMATQAAEAASFIRPEMLAISARKLKQFMGDKQLKRFRLLLERLLRYKQHTLSDREEQLLGDAGRNGSVRVESLPPASRRRLALR